MRGGVTWEEAMEMSPLERKKCFKFIENRFREIKDHSFPIY